MISAIISRLSILLFGTLYPAYASYKAVRTKNVKEYVKWMMYWIVFALFTCIETFTDIFLSWFPFYYEVKVIIVLWLLSPATRGSSTLYRKFVHPMLTKREQEIDEYITQAKEKGYTAVLQLGSKGVNYATSVIMQTAIKGGGNLVQTIRRSYSLSDLSEPDVHRTQDEIDNVIGQQNNHQRVLRSRTQSSRSSSGGRHVDMYFPEVDLATANSAGSSVNVNGNSRATKILPENYNYIRSSEDISSGYSSAAEPVTGGLCRTASLTNTTRPRIKNKRSEVDDDFDETTIDYNMYSTNHPMYPYPQILYYNPHTHLEQFINQQQQQHFSMNNLTKSSNIIKEKPNDYYNDEILNEKSINNGKTITNEYFKDILSENDDFSDGDDDVFVETIDAQIDDNVLKMNHVPSAVSIFNNDTLQNAIQKAGNQEIIINNEKPKDNTENVKEIEKLTNITDQEIKILKNNDEILLETDENEKIINIDVPVLINTAISGDKNVNSSNKSIMNIIDDINDNGNDLLSIKSDNYSSNNTSTSDLLYENNLLDFNNEMLMKRPVTHKKGRAPVPPLSRSPTPLPSLLLMHQHNDGEIIKTPIVNKNIEEYKETQI